jgi:hypothetical protein
MSKLLYEPELAKRWADRARRFGLSEIDRAKKTRRTKSRARAAAFGNAAKKTKRVTEPCA